MQELPKVKVNESEKLQPCRASRDKLIEVPADSAPAWPDLGFPGLQPGCCPPPASEWMLSFQAKPRALSSPQEGRGSWIERTQNELKDVGLHWFQASLSPQNDDLAAAVHPGPLK